MEIDIIVKRAAAGDEQAWSQLVRRYERLLGSVAGGLRMRRCDAEDAAQLTWLALRDNIHTLRRPDHVQAWLRQVMRRQCLRILRQQRTEQLDDEPESWPESAAAAVDAVAVKEIAAAIWAAVDRLPERERLLVRALFDDAQRSYREVAQHLAMPIGAIGPVRMRALERLPGLLAEVGVTAVDLQAVA